MRLSVENEPSFKKMPRSLLLQYFSLTLMAVLSWSCADSDEEKNISASCVEVSHNVDPSLVLIMESIVAEYYICMNHDIDEEKDLFFKKCKKNPSDYLTTEEVLRLEEGTLTIKNACGKYLNIVQKVAENICFRYFLHDVSLLYADITNQNRDGLYFDTGVFISSKYLDSHDFEEADFLCREIVPACADYDGDGFPNYDEVMYGTDPYNSCNFPSVEYEGVCAKALNGGDIPFCLELKEIDRTEVPSYEFSTMNFVCTGFDLYELILRYHVKP